MVKKSDLIKNRITLREVKKHNTVKDGWLVYDNYVYDVTKLIKKHPGALSIKKGLGKDATKIFDNIGHSDRAKKIMKRYLIGVLKLS